MRCRNGNHAVIFAVLEISSRDYLPCMRGGGELTAILVADPWQGMQGWVPASEPCDFEFATTHTSSTGLYEALVQQPKSWIYIW